MNMCDVEVVPFHVKFLHFKAPQCLAEIRYQRKLEIISYRYNEICLKY